MPAWARARLSLVAMSVLLLLTGPSSSLGRNASARFLLDGGALKSSADVLRLFGYPYERHHALTNDGYVLQLDRIPNPGRPPVYLAHPLISAAPVFLRLGPGFALGLLLFDAGYDVWLSNVRGSAYSTDHVRLSSEDSAYWRFSFHEHGVFDHPASIDAVLAVTGRSQLLYVGFSMGTTTFLVMASERPEYNGKVRAAFLMSPVASLFHSRNTLIRILRTSHNATEPITNALSLFAFPHALIRQAEQLHCRGEKRSVCNRLISYLFDGQTYEDFVADNVFFLESFPGSGSTRTFWHYAQLAWSPDVFRPYNFDVHTNMRLYGRPTPPNYPLHRITAPVHIYVSDGDTVSHPRDMAYLLRSVRSVASHFVHRDPTFNHADFVYSRKALPVYRQVMRDMRRALA